MTRETKIGLLVGLAFIIVIGILLSDHLSSTTELPPAPLAQAGDTVRQGVGQPAGPQQPPITVVPPVQVAPQQPVLTREELTRPVPPPVVARQPQQTQPQTPVKIDRELQQVAQQFGQDVVPLNALADPNPLPQQPLQLQQTQPQPPISLVTAHEYKAEEGDSLSRLAVKFFGTNNKANRQAILNANPALKADPNRIIVGRTYIIPSTTNVPTPPATIAQQARLQPSASPEYWYTVKDNDNLWKIANEQLGNGNAWTAIKELNKDTLKGGETVHPNMRLRLPAKPMAAAD